MEKYKIDYQNDNNRNLRRSNSPDSQLRLARTLNVISTDFASGDEKDAPRSIQVPRPSTNIGRHSDRRVKRRAILDSSPSIGAVKKKRFLKELDELIDSGDEAKRIPNARLGAEVPISNNTAIFGSSQYTGCQGDFCDFDLTFLQSKEINNAFLESQVDMSGMSDFRKGLLFSGSTSNNYISKHSSLGKMISSAGKVDGDDSIANSSLTTRALSAEGLKLSTMKKILFRSIIQARQEMPLVKMQLERHKKGEDGLYMRADSYVDTAVGGKVPSHYYQEVPCCLNCYKVYTIVDKARTKAIKAINREQDERRALRTASIDLRTSTADLSVSALTKSSTFSSIYSPRVRDNTSLTGYQVEQLRTIAGAEAAGMAEADRGASDETMRAAIAAVDGLTKLDVAEIRSMAKPPAAVEVVMEAVMILLTGKTVPVKDMHRLLSGGEAFLLMLREFDIEQVTEERLALIEPYVDNPLFRPENVSPVSYCASKFCAWVHGIVHAVRFEKGLTHPRIDPLRPRQDGSGWSASSTASASIPFSRKSKAMHSGKTPQPKMPAVRGIDATPAEELSFVQKLEKMKAIKQREAPYPISRQSEPTLSSYPFASGGRVGNPNLAGKGMSLRAVSRMEDSSVSVISASSSLSASRGGLSKFDPGPTPTIYQGDDDSLARSESPKKTSKRDAKAMRISQKKATDRLASQSVLEGAANILSGAKLFKCSDGITKMPYVVLGKFSFAVTRCSFIVVNDFFDTCDASAILFKPIVQRHEGCQVFCFNYPGQANTVWPRLSAAERDRGAVEPVLNNDWMADRLHELLQHAEQEGEILLSCPFHLVGMGNGACIAAAFAQRYGYNKMYVNSLRSLVSINGFLYPDPQLSSILHSAYQVFESTPHSRPDIPVSYWSRFVFSEDYLKKVNPNLALNIYTAVSNPITNEGRVKIAKGALAHRDLRGALAPDFVATSTAIKANNGQIEKLYPLQIPVVMLQSTENTLVNASNVDSFLVGRNCKHLWSHMLNILSDATLSQAADVTGQWVGRMSSSPSDYHKFSTLGKPGLKMLMECLRNPRGAMSVWTRTGHAVQQEYKAAVLDLLDALACPTDEYTGVVPDNPATLAWKESLSSSSGDTGDGDASLSSEQKTLAALAEAKPPPKVGVLFKLSAPKSQKSNETVVEKETEPNLDRLSSPNPSRPVDLSTPPPPQASINIVATISPSLPVAQPQEEKEEAPRTAKATPKKPRSPLVNRRSNRDEVIEEKEEKTLNETKEAEVPSSLAQIKPSAPTATAAQSSSSPPKPTEAVTDKAIPIEDAEIDSKATQNPRSSSVKPKKTSSTVDSADIPIPVAVPSKSTRAEQKADERKAGNNMLDNKAESKQATDATSQPTVAPPVAANPIAPKPTYPPLPEKVNPAQPTLTLSRQSAAPPQQAPPSRQGRSALNTPGPQPQPQHPQLLKNVKDGTEITFDSSDSQRVKKEWAAPSHIPAASTALELEAELKMKQKEYLELEEKLKKMREENEVARDGRVGQAQLSRRLKFEEEDRKLLEKLQGELDIRQRERDYAEKQRRLELQNIEKTLVEKGYVPPSGYESQPFVADDEYLIKDTNSLPSMSENQSKSTKDPAIRSVRVREPQKSNPIPTPVREMEPKRYEQPPVLPKILTEGQDVVSKLDRMLEDEENARKRGTMSIEEYETVKFKMVERQLERDQKLRQFSAEELASLYDTSATTIAKIGRGYNGRMRFKRLDGARKLKMKQKVMSVIIQRRVRGILGRKRFRRIRSIYLENVRGFFSATQIQRAFRGYFARRIFRKAKRLHCAKFIQRVFRGHLGRKAVRKERSRLAALRRKNMAAAKIQSVWRMKVSREEFRGLRIHVLAATEIQRAYRGYLDRKKINRRKQWESTKPGPERIKLGLQFIEESKLAFERQQEEIDALHRAQARAEARVSNIHAELKESEKELLVLERELQEIDQIERDLSALTHERQLLADGIQDATGMPRLAGKGHTDLVIGKESNKDNDPIMDRRRKAEAYALEMTIQLKRAEREKKRQELEIEFAAVFQEVDKKKKALAKLELALSDMESTRERKDREFRRLQKNLMQLLLEQKKELDDLREKGIELETATATTAAAAIATAQKAKEHEKRSTAMFSQTEELMKFQFMSMSLSYFSSLNMLKSLRDMNADTTSAAIAMSADAAAAAAGAAAAANLPSVKKMNLGASDFIEATIQRKKTELEKSERAEKELKVVAAQSIPDNVRTWTVTDVARWLDALTLSQYSSAFIEASVDGPFLLELREEDLVQVLNIKHKLHVRKILISRDKLKPMSQQEKKMMQAVEIEDSAEKVRKEMGVPSIDTVFSQARNGRVKRVEESLNQGFKIDTEDERGNTLLLLAAQNSNRKLAEMLVVRGANVNHQNASGNTALHFALAFDKDGSLGEYLIEHGADDSIENIDGLTPYDGVAA